MPTAHAELVLNWKWVSWAFALVFCCVPDPHSHWPSTVSECCAHSPSVSHNSNKSSNALLLILIPHPFASLSPLRIKTFWLIPTLSTLLLLSCLLPASRSPPPPPPIHPLPWIPTMAISVWKSICNFSDREFIEMDWVARVIFTMCVSNLVSLLSGMANYGVHKNKVAWTICATSEWVG